MPKYTEAPANTIPDPRWFKRIANEMAENNRLLRKFMKAYRGVGDQDTTTQDDDAGN